MDADRVAASFRQAAAVGKHLPQRYDRLFCLMIKRPVLPWFRFG
jgi:hypothetical protein